MISAEQMLWGYANGIFPMAGSAEDPTLMWYDPQHRGILPIGGVRISKSMRQHLRKTRWRPVLNGQFSAVVHACAARPETWINAEKLPNFSPSPGKITQFHAPGGLGVRMDSAIYDGYVIPPYYDSLIGKLIVHGRDRPEALARLGRALSELIVDGVDTTTPLFDALLQEPDIQDGNYSIHWLERWLSENVPA